MGKEKGEEEGREKEEERGGGEGGEEDGGKGRGERKREEGEQSLYSSTTKARAGMRLASYSDHLVDESMVWE